MPANSAPADHLVGVTKVYGLGRMDYLAVRGVIRKISNGEVVSIIGPQIEKCGPISP